MKSIFSTLLITGAFAWAADAAPFPKTVVLRNFFKSGNDSLTFTRPILVKPYPAEDSAFIVLQQGGQILTVRWNGTAWRRTDTATVTVMGGSSGSDEQGLLGFAFHPKFSQNRKYYVYFVGGTQSTRFNVLAERVTGTSGRPATSDTQRTVLRLRDPYDNHNGGTIAFDTAGHLVLGIGDGGTVQGDPQNRAQNKDSLFGKFLRFNVDSADAFPADTTRNYAIPADNPFKDSTNARPEIWAYGARNPFRWSFHPVTGEIWAGDVGQDDWEEITRVPKGANLGWRLREGPACYNPTTNCPSAGILPPALSVPNADGTSGSAIIGGVFFVGSPSVAYNGAYIFGEHGSSQIWAARVQDGNLVDTTLIGNVNKAASFDRDRQGRILVTSISPTIGFSITSNIGRVLVLESNDMFPGSVVGARPAVRLPGAKPLSLADVLSRPEAYAVTGLDGRSLEIRTLSRQAFRGAVLARKKGSGEPAQLIPLVW